MRILACGSRGWTDAELIHWRLAGFGAKTTIIHGCAKGADSLAEAAAVEHGYSIECYPPDYDAEGPGAPLVRNLQMLDSEPDLVLAFSTVEGGTAGTRHTLTHGFKRGIPVEIWTPDGTGSAFQKAPARGRALLNTLPRRLCALLPTLGFNVGQRGLTPEQLALVVGEPPAKVLRELARLRKRGAAVSDDGWFRTA